MHSHPFKIEAFVLLPDHLHCIWPLQDGDNNFSTRWRLIKSRFTRRCADEFPRDKTRKHKKEQSVWQRRFWEHQIRNETDFRNHVEYIHYNPVRHRYAPFPKDWPHSSFHRYVQEGKYSEMWGAGVHIDFRDRTFGE